MDMLQRMESGRFKVFKHLNDFWEEFRLYQPRRSRRQRGRRPNVRHAVRADDVAPCLNGAKLPKLSSQARLPQIERRMRKFVTWTSIKTEHINGSWSFDPEHRLVAVVTQHGRKCTQLGGLPLEYLIKLLMRELAGSRLPDAY